jgi:hypothetical protein
VDTPLEVFPVDRPELFDQQLLFMVGANYEVQAHEGEEGEQVEAHYRGQPHHQHTGEVHWMARASIQSMSDQSPSEARLPPGDMLDTNKIQGIGAADRPSHQSQGGKLAYRHQPSPGRGLCAAVKIGAGSIDVLESLNLYLRNRER